MLKTKSNISYQIIIHITLIIVAVIMILPFILLFMSSITEETSLIRNGYSFFPKAFSLDAYRYIFSSGGKVFRSYGMTILVTVIGTPVSLAITSMLAYGLSRNGLPFRRVITFYVFFTMLFNGGLVPTYLMYTGTFHIKNSLFALLVPSLLVSAVNVLLIRTYFSNSIPEALYEAAAIDGAGQITTFFRIALPLAKPILVTTSLFTALGYWNDWLNGLYYISEERFYTVQMLLNKMIQDIQFLSSGVANANVTMIAPTVSIRMAIAFVAVLPILLIYPFLQKYFAKGIALGAVKG